MVTLMKNWVRHIGSALSFRPALFCLVAVVVAIGISIVDSIIERGALPWLPEIELTTVRDLLRLLAGSMLTVVTVTLSVLMLVLSLVAGQASPRAMPELMADPVTQNSLGTFLATFVFSLASLLFFGLGATTGAGITLTFVVALLYVATAIRYFVQWIGHVANTLKLNRMIEQIHSQAQAVLVNYFSDQRFSADARQMPPAVEGQTLKAQRTGYVQLIDLDVLSSVAEDNDLMIDLSVREGTFVHPAQNLMTVAGLPNDAADLCDRLFRAVVTDFERSHKGDPLLGFELLAEVACRALSPGVNDPQTAVTCIQFAGGLLCQAASVAPADYPSGVSPNGRVRVEQPGFGSMIKRALRPVARDAASFFEVLDTVTATLQDLAETCDPSYFDAVEDIRSSVLFYGDSALVLDSDKAELARQGAAVKAAIAARLTQTG